MPSDTDENSRQPRVRLFVPGTQKTYKQAAAEKLAQVSHSSKASDEAEDDPCAKKEDKRQKFEESEVTSCRIALPDSRFQQQNQTLRCFVMYTDFFRCEKILNEGHEACTYFQDVYKAVCPNAWISHWDELRSKDLMPWSKEYYKAAKEAEKRKKRKE